MESTKSQIRPLYLVIAFLMLFVSCQRNDSEYETVQQIEQEVEFVKLVSNETTSMLSSVIGDLSNEFRSLSPSKLSNFNSESFTGNSILSYSKTSPMLSPHIKKIERVFEESQMSKTVGTRSSARTFQDYTYTSSQEQGFILDIQNAFSLMPDIEAFKSEIVSINSRISDEITDEGTRLKLLTISATSEATAVYWAENQEQILAEMQSAKEQWTGKHSTMVQTNSDSLMYTPVHPMMETGSTCCCFQGSFEWSWKDFGSSVVGGAVGGAVWAAFANVIPGLGQVAWGASIAGGAVSGGGAYAGYQFTQWMFCDEVDAENTTREEGPQDRQSD